MKEWPSIRCVILGFKSEYHNRHAKWLRPDNDILCQEEILIRKNKCTWDEKQLRKLKLKEEWTSSSSLDTPDTISEVALFKIPLRAAQKSRPAKTSFATVEQFQKLVHLIRNGEKLVADSLLEENCGIDLMKLIRKCANQKEQKIIDSMKDGSLKVDIMKLMGKLEKYMLVKNGWMDCETTQKFHNLSQRLVVQIAQLKGVDYSIVDIALFKPMIAWLRQMYPGGDVSFNHCSKNCSIPSLAIGYFDEYLKCAVKKGRIFAKKAFSFSPDLELRVVTPFLALWNINRCRKALLVKFEVVDS